MFYAQAGKHRIIERLTGTVIICMAAIFLYGPIINAPFQFDDFDFILNNPSIRDITGIPAIWDNLSQPSRFIPFLTFALNYHFHQNDPAGYHLVNILIHVLSALCVWGLASHAISKTNLKSDTHLPVSAVALMAALLFVVHPVQTQAVTYISQRFASLAAFFYLFSLWLYVQGRETQIATGRVWSAQTVVLFIMSLIVAVLGMFSKEFVVTLPLIVILYEMCFFQQEQRWNWKRMGKAALFALPLLLIVPMIFSFRPEVLFSPRASSSHHGDVITFSSYLLTQVRVFAKFLQLLFFPVGQNLEYDFALSRSIGEPAVIGCGLLLTGFAWIGMRLWRTQRILAFSIFWFFLTLSSHLVPRRYVIAEHKLYIASFGFCLGTVMLLMWVGKKRVRVVPIFLLILLTLSVLTYQRNQLWRDPVALWEDVTHKSPGKPRAWLFMGLAYFERGENEKALTAYGKALQLDSTLERAYHNRGKVHAQMKNYPAALADYNQALKYNDKLADIYNNRGNIYRMMERYPPALADYAKAIRLNPDYTEAFNNRGIVYKKMKRYDLAIADFSTAIRLDPDYSVVYNNRGNLYYQLGRRGEAVKDYDRAITLYQSRPLTAESRSQLAMTHLNRALFYARRKEYDRAADDARQAVSYGYGGARRYLELWEPLAAED